MLCAGVPLSRDNPRVADGLDYIATWNSAMLISSDMARCGTGPVPVRVLQGWVYIAGTGAGRGAGVHACWQSMTA